jgi:prepilin-type N-terminal cleavage/methylation domain-containing protein
MKHYKNQPPFLARAIAHGANVILSAAKDLVHGPRPPRSFAALRMTGALAGRDRLTAECPARAARRGFSLLEFEVALVVLGIALTGLFPLTIMYSRGLEKLERRGPVVGQWYLVPPADVWARKLGAAATLTNQAPGPKPPPPVLIADDGDAGYSETGGGWVVESDLPTTQSFQADHRRHAPAPDGSPTDAAVWTFTGITPGWYQVQATWLEASDQTAAAQYTIYDGDTALAAVSANQQIAPAGPTFQDRPWKVLTTQYIRSGSVRAELAGQAAVGYVVADAVRLFPIENNVQILSLERSLGSEEVTARVSVEVLVPH